MGWDFCEADREATPLLYFERHVMPSLNCRLLAYEAVDTTVYAVCEDGSALVCLTQRNCGYKLIEEAAGPAEANCPKRLLDMLSCPAPTKWAEEWRKRCLEKVKSN